MEKEVENREIYLVLFVFLVTLVFATPIKGDEPNVYLPVLQASSEKWPRFNLIEVAYGLSPLYTWFLGLFAKLIYFIDNVYVGRILSLLCFILALLYFDRKWKNETVRLLVFFNPFTLFLAVRIHPYWPSLLLFIVSLGLMERKKTISFFVRVISANVCNFSMFGAGRIFSIFEEKAKKLVLLSIFAIVIGVSVNWFLYGGIYPESFKSSIYYLPYKKFDGFSDQMPFVVLSLSGLVVFMVKFANRDTKGLYVSCIAGLFLVFLSLMFNIKIDSVGLFGSLFHVIDYELIEKVFVFMGGGVVGFGIEFTIHMVLVGIILALTPFPYERYAWMSLAFVLINYESLLNQKVSKYIFYLFLIIGILFSVFGSL